jgi:hypothetical protein
VAARDDFRLAFARHWQTAQIDILLSPVGPTPAPKIGTAKYWNYTSYWNLVNYPAAVFPTGLFVESKDKDHDVQYRNTKEKEVWESYDSEVSVGVRTVRKRWANR